MDVASFDVTRALTNAAPKLPSAATRNVDAAACDFEAVFLAQMLEQMWAEVPTDGPMGGGTGERIFRSLMIQDIGRQMATQGGIGLADEVKREMLAMQQVPAK